MKELKPIDVQLGNFISCFGKTEMVTGIVPIGEGSWYIEHRRWNQDDCPLPPDMMTTPDAILLTDDWKKCLKIDQYKLPEWIKYVHQAQNYMKWYADVNLLERIDWNLLPKNQD